MKVGRVSLGAIAGLVLSVCLVGDSMAQVPDHLKCFKIKDGLPKTVYTGDLGGLVPESGCLIKAPATFACVPSTKTNVAPTPPGGGGGGTPGAFACYKVKCPKGVELPEIQLKDQFGTRSARPRVAKLLCAPSAPTTTTSTTSTTLPCNGEGQPCGAGGCCTGCCSGVDLTCTTTNCCLSCLEEYWESCSPSIPACQTGAFENCGCH